MIYKVKSNYGGGNQIVEADNIIDAVEKAKKANLSDFDDDGENIPHEDIEPFAVELIANEIVR